MDTISQLLTGNSVAHAVLTISLVAALGLILGSIRVFGVSLGIAGVLFAGLLFGHFHISLSDPVMEFAREFGLILYVYTIGVQVGPGFMDSLRRQGLPLNVMAAAIVLLGVAVTLAVASIGRISIPAAVGLYSGATTNIPSLIAAQQALKDVPGITSATARLPGLGCAIAYPFGIIGVILGMVLVRSVFRIHVKEESEAVARLQAAAPPPTTMNIQVSNANLDGLPIRSIPGLDGSGIVVSRVLHDGEVSIAQSDTRLALGDVLLAVGSKEKLQQLRLTVGTESGHDLTQMPSTIIARRILVTRKSSIGKSLLDLDLPSRYGVRVTRVSRAEIQFTPGRDYRLGFGDTLLVVGEEPAVMLAAREMGDSISQLNYPQLIPLFVGLGLGVLAGSIPFRIPGVPAPVTLGLAGGPLIVAILLSRLGRVGPLVWYMPISANFMLREVGIVLFLACVGLKSGDQFVHTLTHGQGLEWMAWSTLITLIPVVVVAAGARLLSRTNYVLLTGVVAGSTTNPPALSFAAASTGSETPNMSYATVYPLTMILRIVTAQAMIILLTR